MVDDNIYYWKGYHLGVFFTFLQKNNIQFQLVDICVRFNRILTKNPLNFTSIEDFCFNFRCAYHFYIRTDTPIPKFILKKSKYQFQLMNHVLFFLWINLSLWVKALKGFEVFNR